MREEWCNSCFGATGSQRVANDGNGAQAHCHARDNRAEEHTEKWIEHGRRNPYSERVLNEREEKILPDVSHHRAAEDDRFDDPTQVASEECDSGTLHRHKTPELLTACVLAQEYADGR
jgi:hypothetical protein